ncbi:hypothetical protein GGR54DRAFT_585349 [Hypoxylon sp. NC1633]|nr:hypothetical protein GGR54DRAFT_585349 [Hypoxylon sp. NC1633]
MLVYRLAVQIQPSTCSVNLVDKLSQWVWTRRDSNPEIIADVLKALLNRVSSNDYSPMMDLEEVEKLMCIQIAMEWYRKKAENMHH